MHTNHFQRVIVLTCLLLSGLTCGRSVAESPVLARYEARDTLARLTDSESDAQACLDGLTWSPGPFSVTCEVDQPSMRRVIVSFPSPVPSGDAANDRVTMEWHQPFSEDTEQSETPAVLVVHESGRAMPVGRMFARAFQAEGLHAFLIHLPYYGLRRSLGGFVVASAASLDRAYQTTFVMLAGGNLYDLVLHGQQDAANFRRDLERAGFQGDALRRLLWQIEPTRVAHRLDPQRTWLYTAEQDQVVPLENALALARAARLNDDHHVRLPGGHYTAIVHFATIVRQVAERIREP